MARIKKADIDKRTGGVAGDSRGVSQADRDLLDRVLKWKQESESIRSNYEERWSRNIKLMRGIFTEDEKTRSNVRKRDKIFHRKIWAIVWRLLASGYQTFLRDQDTFKIEGRDRLNDWHKAGVLQSLVEYRRDQMYRQKDLFLKSIWAMQDMFQFGWCAGEMVWIYNESDDCPDFILYPNEQVYPDMTAELPYQMRYCIFESYLDMDELKRRGLDNLDKLQPTSIPNSNVRNARHQGYRDPLQNPGANEYPRPGRFDNGGKDNVAKKYVVWKCVYKEGGKIKYCLTGQGDVVLSQPKELPVKKLPVIFGQCLTVAHRLFGEGFPEPLEGPQESYNYNLNMRKDNVALALNRQKIVSRYGNVDLQSLMNNRPGGVTMADDVDAIKELDTRDVTSSSYAEASADDAMMQEMSGITPGKMGMGQEYKATTAQINYQESNAKIDLFLAIVGETFFREFFSVLADHIQRYETDEKVFRIANDSWRKKEGLAIFPEVNDIEDFEADCIVNAGLGTVSRENEVRQLMLAIDRMIMANQALSGMAQMGVMPNGGLQLFDITEVMKDMLAKIGRKDTERYVIKVQPPQQTAQGAPGDNGAMAGRIQPQMGGGATPNTMQMEQQGQMGGL